MKKWAFHDTIAVAGLGLLCYGLWLIWPPVMWVVLGVVLLAASVQLERGRW